MHPIFSILLIASLLTGCAAYRDMKYPLDWPRLRTMMTNSDCRHLNGEYRNEADRAVATETFGHAHLPRSVYTPLASVLGVPTREDRDTATESVVLIVDNNKLKAWTRKQDGSDLSPLTVPDNWQCEQGVLRRSERDNKTSEQDIIRRNSRKLSLGLSDDGALVVERSDKSVGAAFVILPYSMGGNAWTRYRRITPSMEP